MNLMLKSRHMEILKLLFISDKPISGKQLAEVAAVTTRTVINDIDLLNSALRDHDAVIINTHGIGYVLRISDELNFRTWLSENFYNHADTVNLNNSDYRVKELIRFLLTVDNFIKLEDLANSMYVSKSTLQNDLKEAKKLLQSYSINVEVKPYYGIKLFGNEMKFRFAISEFLFVHDDRNSIFVDKKIMPIPEKELAIIRDNLLKQTYNYGIELSDGGINDLVIHIAIASQRVILGHQVDDLTEDILVIEGKHEYQVAKKILDALSNELEMDFPKSEIVYIAMHLLGTKLFSSSEYHESGVKMTFEPEVYQYTYDIVKTIDEELGLEVSKDNDLIRGLYLHLTPAINRLRYGMSLRNPMLESIKSRLPMAFQAGIIARTVLKEKTGYEVSENEIGYIALHVGAAIERNKLTHPPKRCIVVCGSGFGSAQLLNYRLRSQFAARLELVKTMGYYKLEEASFKDIDFVISTVPIPFELPVPVILVNALLGSTELNKIEHALADSQEPKLEFLREDLTFISKEFETRDDVIRFLCDQMKERGMVSDSFYDLVQQRELITSTAYGNLVAIPHPLIPKTDTTVWAICTLRKPVQWEGKPVQFVCLLCIVADGKVRNLSPMYNLLVKLVHDEALVQQIMKCNDFPSICKLLKLNI